MFGRKKKHKRSGKGGGFLVGSEAYDILCGDGYTRLSNNPEVQMATGYIADLISSMTIRLMRNTEHGDDRVRNALSRKIDIAPCAYMTRKTWMYNIVRNMLIEGNQIVLPYMHGWDVGDLELLSPASVSLVADGEHGYRIIYKGQEYHPDDVLHFQVNPDPDYPWKGMGYRTVLKDIVGNLKQAGATKKAFMSSKWRPSVIVKVDGMVDDFSSPEGRAKLAKQYIETNEVGEPWMIPADQFEITQIKPLSLTDLAINDAVTLDKKTVAGVFDVPPHVLGAGTFSKEEHRNFINTRIMPLAQIIQQELPRKLIWSENMYFRLSSLSLYGYDMQELAAVGDTLSSHGIMTGNEVRNWIGEAPREGLDELTILENFIPVAMSGQQQKLLGGDGDNEGANSK